MIDRHLPIAVRGFTRKVEAERDDEEEKTASKAKPRKKFKWILVFDTETTNDAFHALRFGTYQLYKEGMLHEQGVFFDPDGVTDAELLEIERFIERRNHLSKGSFPPIQLMNVQKFRDRVFLRYAWERRGLVVGFNLPFDLARIAIRWVPARGKMYGGFSFDMSDFSGTPRVRVKPIGSKMSLMDLTIPEGQDTPRGMRNRNLKVPPHRGYFCDVSMLAKALRSQNFSLASLGKLLKIKHPKYEENDLGRPIDSKLLRYAMRDVQATGECFSELHDEYMTHRLDKPINKVFSEASLGKAYLEQMGIKPQSDCSSSLPDQHIAALLCAYYGGRSEVRWRRVIRRIKYYDFKSMYPTVNTLQGLWRFMVADGVTSRHAPEEAYELLSRLTPDDFQKAETWKALPLLVKVKPDRDLFPVRAPYNGKTNTIGLNYLTCSEPLWFTLADCLVAKFLSGKMPEILDALVFEPGPIQDELQAINLFGDKSFHVDPERDDVFKRLVDLRDQAKSKGDIREKAIKTIANATSYGVTIETNRTDTSKLETIELHTAFGEMEQIRTTAVEQPGVYYHPALGVCITGAARLMLALAEYQVLKHGLEWVFCDTDSLAIAKPEGMSEEEFSERCAKVAQWFVPLNPYEKPGSILQLEKQNLKIGSKTEHEPLYALALSAKRYVLFNLNENGLPVIRKASAHGLGLYKPPYDEDEAPGDIPRPRVKLDDVGVSRWQYDLWYKAIKATLAGKPESVSLDYHPAFSLPAMGHYTASSPDLLAWFKTFNASSIEGRERTDRERVPPFGFLSMLYVKVREELGFACSAYEKRGRGRPKKISDPSPIAPYTSNPEIAGLTAFDRKTGDAVPVEQLATYRDVLRWYHLSPEPKFANADYLDIGPTERVHVIATKISVIGKEANKVGEFGETDPSQTPVETLNSIEGAGSWDATETAGF